jgi:hypothetical protein
MVSSVAEVLVVRSSLVAKVTLVLRGTSSKLTDVADCDQSDTWIIVSSHNLCIVSSVPVRNSDKRLWITTLCNVSPVPIRNSDKRLES